jgi:hypothetical protein
VDPIWALPQEAARLEATGEEATRNTSGARLEADAGLAGEISTGMVKPSPSRRFRCFVNHFFSIFFYYSVHILLKLFEIYLPRCILVSNNVSVVTVQLSYLKKSLKSM